MARAHLTWIAPEPVQFGNQTITQKHLYIGLFVIGEWLRSAIVFRETCLAELLAGLPMLWIASPVSTFFWLVGSSAILILGHACLMEPGVESEYAGVETV